MTLLMVVSFVMKSAKRKHQGHQLPPTWQITNFPSGLRFRHGLVYLLDGVDILVVDLLPPDLCLLVTVGTQGCRLTVCCQRKGYGQQ